MGIAEIERRELLLEAVSILPSQPHPERDPLRLIMSFQNLADRINLGEKLGV
jgi:hypothetical protein